MTHSSALAADAIRHPEPSPEAELRALYDRVDRAVARIGPICQLSGRCCRFAEYGHTLFVSTLEIRYLVAGAPRPSRPLDQGDHCPWQDQLGRCTARDSRPLGCRIFHCDPTYQESAHEISERSITELKAITQRWDLTWNYAPLHTHLGRERDQGRLSIDLASRSLEERARVDGTTQPAFSETAGATAELDRRA
ncbi:MAG: hypothetical protein ACLQIB_51170 [Isosphaeraceae bacterium]